MSKVVLEQFEGPLDLLLKLIEKDKLVITEISLAHITNQYLNYIEESKELIPEEIADFLLIASKLIYLKSKHLLPDFNLEDEDDASSLEEQLKIYRQYYDASQSINRILNKERISYIRIKPYKLEKIKEFIPPQKLTKKVMKETFKIVLNSIEKIIELPQKIIAKAISIGERIKDIKELIRNSNKLSFQDLVKKKDNKMETVISFLAMLELIKQRELIVKQDKLFGDLSISKYKEIDF